MVANIGHNFDLKFLKKIKVNQEIAQKMKTFQQVQMSLASLGYRRNQSPFNKTQFWIFIKVFLTLISLWAQYILVASTPKQYMDSMYMIVAVTSFNIARLSTFLKNESIYDYINTVEEVLNGSKLPISTRAKFYDNSIAVRVILLYM